MLLLLSFCELLKSAEITPKLGGTGGFLWFYVTQGGVRKVFKFTGRTQKGLLMKCEPTENCTGKIHQKGGLWADAAAGGNGQGRAASAAAVILGRTG